MNNKNPERIIFYIDGFNLYYGIKSKGWNRYKWLDISRLSYLLAKKEQHVVKVNYFTSRVRNAPDKEQRQKTYLEALQQQSKTRIIYGKYRPNTITCYRCGHTYSSPNEKMTDVNIAVEILADAFQDAFDTAILVSGDSDLTAPIMALKKHFPKKKIIIAFPPGRHNVSLAHLADNSFIVGRKKLKDSQLPEAIKKPDGFVLRKPVMW